MKEYARFRPRFACSALLLISACGDTPGERIRIELELEAGPTAAETDTGFSVELEQARIALGPLRAYAPRQPGAVAALGTLRGWLLPVAHAHDGDALLASALRAEWLQPVLYDVMSDPRRLLGELPAESGVVERVRIDLQIPDGKKGEALMGHHVWARGVAVRGEERIAFEGGLELAEGEPEARIDHLPFDALLEQGGRWVLRVQPAAWFKDAHFDRLEDRDGDGVHEITPDTQVRGAWFLGARSREAFEARFELEKDTL